MRAALYTRVSTHDQQTLAMQMDALQEFATRRGWTVIDTVEEIASGATDNRPKRQALLTAARRRQLDVILVWKLDRWGRSLVDLMTTLRELTALGVGFVSLTEALDLTTPAGRACYAVLHMQEAIGRYAEELRRQQGLDVQIRVGLNSGEVVVHAIGSDLHMDYTAVGQTTHLAVRMEQLAHPDTALLTAAALRLVEGYVEVTPLGPVPVKGLPEPVEIYELVRAGPVRSRLQAAAARVAPLRCRGAPALAERWRAGSVRGADSLSHRLLQRLADHKAHDPPGWNRGCGAGLRVAPHTRPRGPHLPGAKAPQEHWLSVAEGVLDRDEDRRNRFCRLALSAPEFRRNPLDELRFPHTTLLLATSSYDIASLFLYTINSILEKKDQEKATIIREDVSRDFAPCISVWRWLQCVSTRGIRLEETRFFA
jgi:hypothetical protein